VSNSVLNTVFEQSKAKGVARLVLLSLADRADDTGRAWCGAKDLCTRTLASRRQVFEAISYLQELGELVIEGKRGSKRCNAYRVTLNQCSQRTSAESALVQSPHVTSAASAPKPLRTPHKNVPFGQGVATKKEQRKNGELTGLQKLIGKPAPFRL
jgi:hypothetical protein